MFTHVPESASEPTLPSPSIPRSLDPSMPSALTFRSESRRGVVKHGDAGYIREPRDTGHGKREARGGAERAGTDEPAAAPDHRRGDGTPTNQTVYLCAFPPADHPHARELTVETRDPSDRAHGVINPDGLHYNARGFGKAAGILRRVRGPELANAAPGADRGDQPLGTPRRYPPSQMTSTGVSIDSAFDGMHTRLERLQVQGVNTAREFGDNVLGLCASSAMINTAVARLRPGQELRKIINRHQKTEPGTARAEDVIEAYRRGSWTPVM